MKKFAKLFTVLLACAIGAGSSATLAACGGNSDKIQVSIGMWPDSTSSASDIAMFNQWKEAFEADYPQYEIVADSYTYSSDTIAAKAISGKLPTVFQTYFTEPEKLVENGWVRDVNDELIELGWLDKMDDEMREALTFDGLCYGVPRDGYGMGMLLNLEMLYDVGVIGYDDANDEYILYDDDGSPLYPTTFDEVREVSELIVENYATGTYGLIVLSANKNGGWQFSNMAWNFGCESLQIENSDGSWTANLNDDGAVAALEWIQEMRQDGLIYPDASASYSDWYTRFGSGSVAMAFCGSDAISLPVTNYNFDIDKIAFVPMPTGDGQSQYSLYGGTPYMFSATATDEQVMGALLFLKYMGRSPETDEISVSALELGYEVSREKGMPILPTIKAWKDEEYLEVAEALEQENINVNMKYYQDFFDTIDDMKRSEEPNYCQDMYGLLDNAIQSVISNPDTANCYSLLTTANNTFQTNYLSKLNMSSVTATDEQVMGALLFLKYMGRSPETDEISVSALELGYEVSREKGMPILPTIKAWKDEEYLEVAEALEQENINVNMKYYQDFFDTIDDMKRSEEPNYCQDMYGLLDNAIQSVISNPDTANCYSLLTTANNTFQTNYLSKLKG